MNVSATLSKYGLTQTFRYLYKDPETNLAKIMDWADWFAGDNFQPQRQALRSAFTNPDDPYHTFVLRIIHDTDPGVLRTIVTNFFINANLVGWPIQEKLRNTYHCNIPWAILLDPTSACNLNCTGCWAAEYGGRLNLTYACVFVHYSDSNIREKTLLETMRSPLFMAYHDAQTFNKNMFRPCLMLENPFILRGMVEKTGAHSTDLQSPEPAEHLCAKCDGYAACWKKKADELWEERKAERAAQRIA